MITALVLNITESLIYFSSTFVAYIKLSLCFPLGLGLIMEDEPSEL